MRQKHSGVEKWWAHLAKFYGMVICLWISEEDLARALIYEEGQVLSENHPYEEIVDFLNECEIGTHDWKHPQFLPSVGVLPPYNMTAG